MDHTGTTTCHDGDAAMSRPATPVRPGAALSRLVTLSVVAALTVGAVVLAWTWMGLPSDQLHVTPGPVSDLRPGLAATATDPGFADRAHGWLVTTVVAETLTNAGAVRARTFGTDGELVTVDPARQADVRVGSQLSMAYTRRLAPALAARLRDGTALPTADEVAVLAAVPSGPAAVAGLQPGDVITRVDGQPATADRLAAAESTAGPVEVIAAVNGAGPARTVTVVGHGAGWGLRWLPRLPGTGGEGTIMLDGVTGGSGGTIMTLAVLDAISPGDLTGGRTVAGTGAIDVDGVVLPVDGVTQKVRAAGDAAAGVFLYPPDAPPASVPDGITAVPVASVDDAVAWLCTHGADDQVCASGR